MNELVYLKNDEPVCSSLQVAEKFEKRHADVMDCSEQWVHKLHGRALAHLKLPT